MIIALNGYGKSGKDTVGNMIQYIKALENVKEPAVIKSINEQGYLGGYDYSRLSGWEVKKFADKMKQVASILTGIPRKKFEDQEFKMSKLGAEWDGMTVREFLQKLGTDAMRNNFHENVWVNALFLDYNLTRPFFQWGNELISEKYPDWIITDCRYPNEAERIKYEGGIVVRINRGAPTNAHISETALDNWDFDNVIDNDKTLDDLFDKVKELNQIVSHLHVEN